MEFQDEEHPKPQTNNPHFISMLGQAFLGVSGLNGINDETGLGTIMAIQEKVIGDKYEKQQQAEKLHTYIEENAILKSQIAERNAEIDNLKRQLDEADDKFYDLEKEVEEYEKLNPNRDMISGIGQQILSGIAVSLVKKSKYAGLLGFDENETTAPQNLDKKANVQISEANETIDETALFINSLNSEQQTEFQQLIKIFKQDSTLIKACLCYIISENS